MKKYLFLILKGMLVGFGKIIPGVSGSLIAISLNIYEESINRISNLFSKLKDNVFFLGYIGLGILISIIFGSKFVLYLLNNYYFFTMCSIIGFITGIVPNMLKTTKIKNIKDVLIVIIPVIFFLMIDFFKIEINLKPETSCLIVILLGFLEAATMIVPGISGTAIYILLGVYPFILNLFSNPAQYNFILFCLGLILGVFIICKIINHLFSKYKRQMDIFITSLTISSIFLVVKPILLYYPHPAIFLIGIILFFVSFMVSKHLNK